MAEQQTHKLLVVGSSPTLATQTKNPPIFSNPKFERIVYLKCIMPNVWQHFKLSLFVCNLNPPKQTLASQQCCW